MFLSFIKNNLSLTTYHWSLKKPEGGWLPGNMADWT